MDSKRFILALTLSVAVMFIVSTIFPPNKPAESNAISADSAQISNSLDTANSVTGSKQGSPVSTVGGLGSSPESTAIANGLDSLGSALPVQNVETSTIGETADSGSVFSMSNVGAAPTSVLMNAYNFATMDKLSEKVKLEIPGQPLIKYLLVTNNGTRIDLSGVVFNVVNDRNIVTYTATIDGKPVTIRYDFVADSHVARVTGSVGGMEGGYIVASMPTTLPVTEKDTIKDFNELAYVYFSKREGATRVSFKSLDPGEKLTVTEPINWLAVKNKYFVFGLLAGKDSSSFAETTITGGPRTSSVATNAEAQLVVPIKGGNFNFDMYAGPQEWKRLNSMGRDFDQVNPYGWAFLRGFLQPIATGVIRLVLWMHSNLNLSYGLVLICLGLLVRIVLWPLNQSTMRSSLKMQELQPELQAVQKRHKDNPLLQREEIMKVYKAHGTSPMAPVLGCLPMLLPMPILLALFFVFQNTIEFRGVPFLWVPDLSTHDPYFIWPVMMAASMFVLSWIGARNAPPNPQTKMMMYFMPGMMLLFFWKMAAGLNLYYAAQNLASLPQQWLISREQAKRRAARGSAPVQGAVSNKSTSGKKSRKNG